MQIGILSADGRYTEAVTAMRVESVNGIKQRGTREQKKSCEHGSVAKNDLSGAITYLPSSCPPLPFPNPALDMIIRRPHRYQTFPQGYVYSFVVNFVVSPATAAIPSVPTRSVRHAVILASLFL
eukprot:749497-Hanusia_phi.AAC.1